MEVSRFSRFRLTFSVEKDNLNLLIPAPTKSWYLLVQIYKFQLKLTLENLHLKNLIRKPLKVSLSLQPLKVFSLLFFIIGDDRKSLIWRLNLYSFITSEIFLSEKSLLYLLGNYSKSSFIFCKGKHSLSLVLVNQPLKRSEHLLFVP